MTTILVGVNGSEESLAALRFAVAEAELRAASVHAVAVWNYPIVTSLPGVIFPSRPWNQQAAQAYEDLLAAVEPVMARNPNVIIAADLLEGDPANALVAAAADADLVVLGAHHSRRRGHRLGSVAHHVAAHSPCPVIVV